ncbi:hypothetical protein BH11ACT8_BH11ACT8_18630 [soil metagenome]
MAPQRVLITGSTDRVELLSKAFEQAGAEPVTLADFGPDCAAVDCYVQLGFTVPARGDTVVRRVRSFLSDGLLERFAIVERVLPLLADSATVLLVTGNRSSEAAAPDDRAARLLILRVLATPSGPTAPPCAPVSGSSVTSATTPSSCSSRRPARRTR